MADGLGLGCSFWCALSYFELSFEVAFHHFDFIKQPAVQLDGFSGVASQIAFEVSCVHGLLSVGMPLVYMRK